MDSNNLALYVNIGSLLVNLLNNIVQSEMNRQHQAKMQERLQILSHKYNKEMEEIRRQNTVKTQIQIAAFNYQLKQLDQLEKNHPLVKPSDYHIEILKQIQRNSGVPLVLTAPFADDTLPDQVNDSGGYINYRTGNYTSFQKAKWLNGAIVKDGYFERPLRQNDRDLDIVYGCLYDLPVIVVNGYVQQKERVYLQISHWRIIPGIEGYVKNLFGPYQVSSHSRDNQAEGLLQIQDQVAEEAVLSTALIVDIYHLLQSKHIRPSLIRYGVTDQKKLQFWAATFRLYYELICKQEPENEPRLRLDEAQMLDEVGCTKEAREAREISRKYQSSKPPSNSLIKRLEEESDVFSHMGFDINLIPQEKGYVLAVSKGNDWQFAFWIPPNYPSQPPKVFIQNGEVMEPITFEDGVWRSDCSLPEIVSAIISS